MSEKVIIFDLGKVVFDYDLNIIANSLSKYSSKTFLFQNMDKFVYKNKELFFQYEKGQISSINFYNSMSNLLDFKNLSFEEFSKIWNEIFTPIQDVIDLIISLSNKYELAILSNTNELHFDYLYKKYSDLFLNFKKLHLSYLMNLRKPNSNIYEQVIKFHKIKPKNIFFTDDNEANVSAATTLGINAFIFKDITKLKQDLISFGIEI